MNWGEHLQSSREYGIKVEENLNGGKRHQHRQCMDIPSEPAVGSNIHSSPVDGKLLCSYSDKLCMQRRLNHYAFCIRHILQDKSAPFKQCQHVARYNGQRCTNAVPLSEDREYCNSHLVVLGMKPKKYRKKFRNDDTADHGAASSAAAHPDNSSHASQERPEAEKSSRSPARTKLLIRKHSVNPAPFGMLANDPIVRPSPLTKLKKDCLYFSQWLKRKVCCPSGVSGILPQKDIYLNYLELFGLEHVSGAPIDKSKVEAELVELIKEELRQVVYVNTKMEHELRRVSSSARSYFGLVKRIVLQSNRSFPTQSRYCRYHKDATPCYSAPMPCCGYCETHLKFDKDQLLFGSCTFKGGVTHTACGRISLNIDGSPSLCGLHMRTVANCEGENRSSGIGYRRTRNHSLKEASNSDKLASQVGVDMLLPGRMTNEASKSYNQSRRGHHAKARLSESHQDVAFLPNPHVGCRQTLSGKQTELVGPQTSVISSMAAFSGLTAQLPNQHLPSAAFSQVKLLPYGNISNPAKTTFADVGSMCDYALHPYNKFGGDCVYQVSSSSTLQTPSSHVLYLPPQTCPNGGQQVGNSGVQSCKVDPLSFLDISPSNLQPSSNIGSGRDN